MLRIGLVGTGMMGATHSSAWRQVPGAVVSAVCSRNGERAAAAARQWGAASYTSIEHMIAETDIDALDICLPTELHRHAVELAAAHGKHVICEKPIAATAEDAEAMIAACRRAGVVFMVAHVTRFHPEFAAARRQCLDGTLGRIGVVHAVRSSGFPGWSDWYRHYDGSGTLLDMAIHDFDFFRWCFGEVKRVFARRFAAAEQDHSLTLLRFENGVIGHVDASWAYPQGTPLQMSLEIAGSRGVLLCERDRSQPIVRFGVPTAAADIADMPLAQNHFARQLHHFAECITQRKQPLVDGTEALASLRISLAALASAQSGRPVFMKGGEIDE